MKKAKAYQLLGQTVYLYRKVLDEMEFPKDENKRYHFSTGLGEFPIDKVVIKDEDLLKDILGEDYVAKRNGYMFVTESLKRRMLKEWVNK
jgi:hypothetical protein